MCVALLFAEVIAVVLLQFTIFFFLSPPDIVIDDMRGLIDTVHFIFCNDVVALSAGDILRFTSTSRQARKVLHDADVLATLTRMLCCHRPILNPDILFKCWNAARRCIECGVPTSCTPAVSLTTRLRFRVCTKCAHATGGMRQLVDRKYCRQRGFSRSATRGLHLAKVDGQGRHLSWASEVDAALVPSL